MASAYLYAAGFGPKTSSSGTQSQTMTIPREVETTPIHNVFISAAHRHIHTASTQAKSIFFRLPPELRNEIYALLLSPPASSLSDLAEYPKGIPIPPGQLTPAILRTCKRIHAEAATILYSTHVFTAHPALLTSLPHLVSPTDPVLKPSILAHIRRWQFCMRLDTDPRFTAAQAKAAFSGAEFLSVRVWQSSFQACDAYVLRLFAGVRGVKVARVGGSVDSGVARALEELMMMEEGSGESTCGCKEREREVWCKGCGKRVDEGWGGRNHWLGDR